MWRDLLIVALLLALHLVLFFKHYTGKYIFPWDFMGGYHAHAYGWLRDGGALAPPGWFPWSSMGFPSALAIQSGSWYAPLAMLDLFNISYTLHVATTLQSLHVLFGALGAYGLARSFGLVRPAAFAMALCFHLSAGFYSNQQHVDIIRAYAWLPWLLLCLQPGVLARSRFYVCVAAVVLFQFLVSAYPGTIVTAAYACVAFCLFNLLALKDGQRWRYTGLLAVVGICGVLMALIKWFPFIASFSLVEMGGTSHDPEASLPEYLLTLFFDYHDDQLLKSDITMRGVYLPMMVFVGLFFCRGQALFGRIGAAFAFMGFLLGAVLYTLMPGELWLPGLNISRFPWTDWRAIVHLGLILLAVEGWLNLYKSRYSGHEFFFRWFVMATVFLGVVWGAAVVGFPLEQIRSVSLMFLAVGICAALLHRIARFRPDGRAHRYAVLLCCLIALGTVWDGVSYHRENSLPWREPWSKEKELRAFSIVAGRGGEEPAVLQFARRPERWVLRGAEDGLVMPYQSHSLYNKCWYEPGFCVLGYDNLRLSRPHNTLFDKLDRGAESERLLAYLRAPQQLLVLPAGAEFNINDFPFGNEEGISLVEGVTANVLSYAPGEVAYRIQTSGPVTVVENEMWWEGWMLTLCRAEGCLKPAQAEHTAEYLRSWDVPPGEWTATLRFRPVGMGTAKAAFLLGLAGLMLYGGWGLRCRKCRNTVRP